MVRLGRMRVGVPDKPLRVKRLEAEARPAQDQCPTKRTPDENQIQTKSIPVAKQYELSHIPLRILILKIVQAYPGIRGYIIEEIIKRGRSVGLGSISSELPRLVKNGKLKRIKDGDSFRYYLGG